MSFTGYLRILLLKSFLAMIFSLLVLGLSLPKPITRIETQRVLTEWMDDKYPYVKRWVMTDEDNEYSELEGYGSGAAMDSEDETDE